MMHVLWEQVQRQPAAAGDERRTMTMTRLARYPPAKKGMLTASFFRQQVRALEDAWSSQQRAKLRPCAKFFVFGTVAFRFYLTNIVQSRSN
jgi:hypothetical protein